MRIPLKKMGDTLDRACKPAGQCNCCPISLSPGDWFYDPSMPDVICRQPQSESQIIETTPCNETDEYLNEASGVVYKYSAQTGMYAVSFAAADSTYVIYGGISGAVVMPGNCTLIFQGGKFTGSLTGNNTAIEAGPVQIFDVGIQLYGSFVNECAYPEWWGAVATVHRGVSPLPDCSAPIQAAIDSLFYKLEFGTGFYYLASTVTIRRRKHIVMQGGGRGNVHQILNTDKALGTILWTNTNIDAVFINLSVHDYPETYANHIDDFASLIWDGGCIDVSRVVSHSNNHPELYFGCAIKLRPCAAHRSDIRVALRGPLARDSSGFSTDQYQNGAGGTAFCISDNGSPSSSGCFFSSLNLDIYGFGTGFHVENVHGSVTSIALHGIIENCYRYVYNEKAGAFSGGVIDCTIQARERNLVDGVSPYLIEGDFKNCYLNPFIWDYPYDRALKMTSWDNVRLGSRMLTILSNLNYNMMMPVKDVSGLINAGDGLLNASVGNYDLRQLGAVNGTVKGRNYIHLIDNDLLGYDKMWGQEDQSNDRRIQVAANGFDDVVILNKSPFDSEGFKMNFNPTVTDMSNASLQVTIPMPTNDEFENNQVRLSLLVVHLKGSRYTYFRRLKVTATKRSTGESLSLFDDSYAALNGGYNDVVLPLMLSTPFNVSKITFLFEDLAKVEVVWQDSGAVPNTVRFKFSVEGRFNIHPRNNIWSASGGAMGNHILRLNKPYLLGTKNYPKISDLPSDASHGAMGLVNGTYPVVKTPQGWMIQNLVGTTAILSSLDSGIGALSNGQSAFNTTLGKPVWWNGTNWVDATGSVI